MTTDDHMTDDLFTGLQRLARLITQLDNDDVWGLCLAFQSGRDANKKDFPTLAAAFEVFHDVMSAEWSRRAAVAFFGAPDADIELTDPDRPPPDDADG